MGTSVDTERLRLEPLAPHDHAFMRELVNTPGWIAFIGDRNVHSEADAHAYIDRIISNPDITYWVVRRREDDCPAGVVSWIQRAYLPHRDIGFAFLPAYYGLGYAYEAAGAVLAREREAHPTVLATTLAANTASIRLLEKLGLRYSQTIEQEGKQLQVFSTEA